MKCPIDQQILTISTREGIEIDYCPSCRGVWLDRGELDKLIERSEGSVQSRENTNQRDTDHYRSEENRHNGRDYHKKKSKSSLLGDIFDF